MLLKNWNELPNTMKNNEVKIYFNYLKKRRKSLFFKRLFDLITSILTIIILFPLILLISIAIKIDSKGPIMYRQVRVTQYGKLFRIYKFRTMVNNAEKMGTLVTTENDSRVTRVGKVLRKSRLDEIPQLLNIILGDMTFVGTRPEVVKYVEMYTSEMKATLLLPAGITSETSIKYKDEERLLTSGENVDEIYVNKVLPQKMKYNLESLLKFGFFSDIKTMIKTVYAVIKNEK